MKKIIAFFLLTYYLLGILFLPQGELSIIVDLSLMYQHCKTTEDQDMTSRDFITDHLINTDCWFDKHDNDGKQKHHLPITVKHVTSTINYFICLIKVDLPLRQNSKRKFECKKELKYYADYNSKIFKPPMNC